MNRVRGILITLSGFIAGIVFVVACGNVGKSTNGDGGISDYNKIVDTSQNDIEIGISDVFAGDATSGCSQSTCNKLTSDLLKLRSDIEADLIEYNRGSTAMAFCAGQSTGTSGVKLVMNAVPVPMVKAGTQAPSGLSVCKKFSSNSTCRKVAMVIIAKKANSKSEPTHEINTFDCNKSLNPASINKQFACCER